MSRFNLIDRVIHAADYGLKTSNTTARNNRAMAAAVAAAVAAGKELHLPAGILKFNMHGLGIAGAIPLTSPIVIRGAGRGKTVLKCDGFVEGTFTPHTDTILSTNDNGATLFKRTAGTHSVTLSDMTLQGPDEAELTGDLNNVWAVWSGGGGGLTMERVEMRMWCQCVKMSPEYPVYPGNGTNFKAVDCYFGFRCIGVLHVSGDAADKDTSDFIGCDFVYEDGAAALDVMAPTSNGQDHCTYINRGVSFSATRCRFLKSHGVGEGWLHYGHGAGIGIKPLYSKCDDSYFGPGVTNQMLTGSFAPTVVTGCEFRTGSGGNAVLLQGDSHFSNCKFFGEAGAQYGIIDNQSTEVLLSVVNCSFTTPGAGDGYVYPISRNHGTDKLWRVECCTFGDLNAAGSAILVNTGKVLVRDCVFASSTGVYSVRLQGGTAIVESCRHTNAKGIYCDAFTGDCVLELYNNRFDISCQPQLNPGGANKIKIRGERNRFYENPAGYGEGFFLVGGGAGVTNLSGDLQCGRGIGGYTCAAGVLTINWSYDTFSIDEGSCPTINNINLGGATSGIGALVAGDHNRFCGAVIKLHGKQPFSVGAEGNIVAAGGARTVDSIVTLQYFPVHTKWYEV